MKPVEQQHCKIEVLLATFNGARFLREQLDSLFAQTCQTFRVIVRDDASTDSTVAIVNEYAARFPGRLKITVNPGRLGAWGNFMELLSHDCSAQYVMFCDQDDVWLPTKIETEIQQMLALENLHGATTPILVCTDLRVVDETLRVVMPSLWHDRQWRAGGFQLGPLLMMNKVSGCTILANRSLLNRVLPIASPEPVLYDWWLALAASCFGIIHPCFDQTILYRQHARNVVGERARVERGGGIGRYLRIFRKSRLADNLDVNRGFAWQFRSRYESQLSKDCLRTLLDFEQLPSMPGFTRRFSILRNRFFLPRLRQNLRLLIER